MPFRRGVLVALYLAFVLGTALAQEYSDRQRIAVFRLSYYGQPQSKPPPDIKVEIRGRRGSLTVELRGTGNRDHDNLYTRALGAVDEQIRGTFINLGRFDVIGMSQRMTASSVDDFVDTLSEFQRQTAQLPEAVLLGQQTFTKADFDELVGGFVVVVPSVSWYDLEQLENGRFRSTIQTSFTFISVEDLSTFGQFFVETSGVDDRPEGAVRQAVDEIAGELSFSIRSMPQFQLRTGIIDVTGGDVVLEFGRDMGLQLGDEYAIVTPRVLAGGYVQLVQTGLIVIKEVQENFSLGQVLYASPRASVGDQLQEVPRRGIEGSVYVNVLTDGLESTYTVGVRAILSRGFYDWRPMAGIELPLRGLVGGSLFPVNLSVGGEWNIFLGRVKLSPYALVGVGGAVPMADDADLEPFYLSHIGAHLGMSTSVLLTRDVMAHASIGLGYWVGVYGGTLLPETSSVLSSYGGLVIGGGVTIK